MTQRKTVRPVLLAAVLAAGGAAVLPAALPAGAQEPTTGPAASPATRPAADFDFEITFDTSEAPDMADFAERAAPVADEWYPKIVALLPSEGFDPPKKISVRFDPEYKGVAACSGTRIVCNPEFYRKNPGDIGSIVHELVHVVQGYGYGNKPVWLVEGIADQIRWFVYEPTEKRSKLNADRARYDASYQTSGAFIDWVQRTYDANLVAELNAALRAGKYEKPMWEELTGKTVEELGGEWKESLRPPTTRPE